MPIADPSAFELGAFTEEQSEELEEQLSKATARAAENATREYRDRLRDSVQHLASKLRGGKGTRLHGSLLTNLEELLDADLNVTADPDLQQVIEDAKASTSQIERAVRTREDCYKNQAASTAEAIDKKLAALF
jgi:plasmid stabilization system protein ParE